MMTARGHRQTEWNEYIIKFLGDGESVIYVLEWKWGSARLVLFGGRRSRRRCCELKT